MSEIGLLTEDLINKIAAGEVVQRPASIVKELVENALDAGATKITIELKDSGKELIKVTDNGKGMSEEDARKSILRHATSKIKFTQDLFSIETLGFRGEALASIAAVSKLSIITKKEHQLEGIHLSVEGGVPLGTNPIASDVGTSIQVRDLFYNTPARKKFLKTDAVELRHIIDIITNYALMNELVSIKLLHENHELLYAPEVEDQRSNLASIYGVTVAKDLLEVDYEDDSVRIEGFISKPLHARNDKNQQLFFVNRRWIKDQDLAKAIYAGFHARLFVNKHPVFVLNLTINPEKVDVNVHPQKSEIKIEELNQVTAALTACVKETLEKHNLIPIIDVETQELAMGTQVKSKYVFDVSEQKTLKVEEREEEYSTPEEDILPKVEECGCDDKVEEITEVESLPEMKIYGQIHKTFFVAETKGGVLFIDQHAAHERVMYEKFLKEYGNHNVAMQKLLKGEVLEFTAAQKVIVDANLKELQKFGFALDAFGGNTYVLNSVPSLFGRLQPKKMFHVLLDELTQGKNSLEVLKETIITRMACRAAVMAGDELNTTQIKNILDDLKNTQFPYTCPHGRPTIIKTDFHELERKFKRCG